jgi:hypothetical protein
MVAKVKTFSQKKNHLLHICEFVCELKNHSLRVE